MHHWKILTSWLILFFALPFALAAQEAGELMKAGDAAYAMRAEGMEPVLKAIKKWEHASMVDPKEPAPVYKIAMAYCYLGRFAKNGESASKLYSSAHEYAKKAVEKDGKSGAAHFWLAYSLDKSVENKNKFAKLAVKGDITSHYISARTIDPAYYFGGPDRGIAALALYSPVPSLTLAKKHSDASLTHGPEFSTNLLLAAEIRIKEGDKHEAMNLLKKVLDLQPMPGFEKELAQDQKKSQSLLDKIKNP